MGTFDRWDAALAALEAKKPVYLEAPVVHRWAEREAFCSAVCSSARRVCVSTGEWRKENRHVSNFLDAVLDGKTVSAGLKVGLEASRAVQMAH